MAFPYSSDGKESAYNAGDLGSIPGSGRCPGERKKVKLLSRVQLFGTPWTIAYQVPLSMGFSRQEYWSGLPLPSPGDLPDPGIEPRSSGVGRRFTIWATRESLEMATCSSILAWEIPWTEEPGWLYSSWGQKESDMTEHAPRHRQDSKMADEFPFYKSI